MLIDSDGQFLTKKQILELSKTPEGRKKIFQYVAQARSAYCAQRIMEHLGVVPDEATQQAICLMIFDINYRLPVNEIFNYVDSMQAVVEDNKPIHEC